MDRITHLQLFKIRILFKICALLKMCVLRCVLFKYVYIVKIKLYFLKHVHYIAFDLISEKLLRLFEICFSGIPFLNILFSNDY